MSNKLPPETYNLRVATIEIIRNLIEKKLFKSEKDALLFVCFKAQVNNALCGFEIQSSINDLKNLETAFDQIYDKFKKFKAVLDKESNEQLEII